MKTQERSPILARSAPALDYRAVACDLCGSEEHALYGEASHGPGVIHPVVVRCRRCRLLFANPQATPESLGRYYTEDYEPQTSHVRKKLEAGLEKNRREIRALHPSPGTMLDVGMGWGYALYAARTLGWEVYGTEVSETMVETARQELGIENAHLGSLMDAAYPANRFDLVFMWHTLEHVDSPGAYMREIQRVLKPGGIALFGVPHADNWVTDVLRALPSAKYRGVADHSAHTFHFSPRTLSACARQAGLRIDRCWTYWSSDRKRRLNSRGDAARRLAYGILQRLPNSGPYLALQAHKTRGRLAET